MFEFKTSDRPRADAEADYAKRKAQVSPEEAASITFVFVTSRSWPGQGQDVTQWEATKRAEKHFKDVKVLDATAVISWLHLHPAVAIYGCRQILRVLPHSFDAQSIDEFAEIYEQSFKFRLPPAVLLAGRSELASSLREDGVPPGITNLLADDEEEAAAFVCRALLSGADSETQNHRLATSLVIADFASARALDGATGLTLILVGSAKSAADRVSVRNSVVACRVFGEVSDSDAKSLGIPNLEEFADALSSGGDIDKDQARDLGMKNGRILTILKRNHGNGTPPPIWALPDAAQQQEVRAAALCGAWSESHASDRAVVELLSGSQYPNVGRRLRAYTRQKDSLLIELERIWALRAPVDAFNLLSTFFGSDDLLRFSEAIRLVFDAEKSEVPDPDEIYDSSRPKGHSARLKTGLAQNVLLLASLGDMLGIRPESGNCRDFAAGIVSAVPNLGTHPGFLVAFGRQLPYLAEAAPEAFLDALEPLLGGDQETLKWFLTPYEGRYSLFPNSYVHPLIWALQLLAWMPEHFGRVCRTLARLAVADLSVEATGQPRPLYSLTSILTPWAPQTSVPVGMRVRFLRSVVRDFPQIAAPLLFGLLPEAGSAVDVHAKPRFAELRDHSVTYGDIWRVQLCVVEELAHIKTAEPKWFREMTTHLYAMRDDAFEVAIAALREVVQDATGAERPALWKILRAEVAKHQQFEDADWSMNNERINSLQELCVLAEPDPTEVAVFLFDEDNPDLGISDWKESQEELKRRRADAVSRFLEQHQLSELVEFAGKVSLSHYIATSLEELRVPLGVLKELLLASSAALPFAEQISRVAYRLHGNGWLDEILAPSDRLPVSLQRVALGALIPDNNLVKRISSMEPMVADFYWKSSPVRVWDLDGKGFQQALEYWSQADRDLEIVEQVALKSEGVPSPLLLQILSKTVLSLVASAANAKRFNTYTFERLLLELDGRPDVPLGEIAKLEWPLMSALYLGRSRRLAIHELMATDPEEFLQILSLGYRAKGVPATELSEDQRALATNAGKVLISFDYSPYLEPPVNTGALTKWIVDSRELADVRGYGEIARIYIGHLLAHSPSDEEDNLWPHRQVRELLERLGDADIESGISTERFNMRGAHSDSVAFYRRHAEEGRAAADKMAEWPAVQALIRRIAESDESWSERALRDRRKEELDNSL